MYQSYRRSFYSIWYSLGNRKDHLEKDIYVEMDTDLLWYTELQMI